MEVWSSILVALVLFVAAGWLVDAHMRTWYRVQKRRNELDPRELDYRARQFRRRMQTSAMLGLIGTGILVGQLISLLSVPRWLVLLVWLAVLVLVVWILLLALADMISTRFYFSKLKQDYVTQEARIQAELRRMQRARDQGGQSERDPEAESPDAGDDAPGRENTNS